KERIHDAESGRVAGGGDGRDGGARDGGGGAAGGGRGGVPRAVGARQGTGAVPGQGQGAAHRVRRVDGREGGGGAVRPVFGRLAFVGVDPSCGRVFYGAGGAGNQGRFRQADAAERAD